MTPLLSATFTHRFPNGPAVSVDRLELPEGAGVTVLFGESGSGKTTVLRCLAGLTRPDDGEIRFGDTHWFDQGRNLWVPPQGRSVGFVPQDYALFPHLSVTGNVAYGLHRVSTAERDTRVATLLERLDLTDLAHRRPRELSGGQQQRVALARAAVRQPNLLLLDEPLSALDTPTRHRLRGDLRRWLAAWRLPTLLVTHDRSEALALGDRMIVISEGRIQQQGPVIEVFNRPASVAVARLVGTETVLPARVLRIADGLADLAAGHVTLVAAAQGLSREITAVQACIRAEDVMLVADAGTRTSARNRFQATVASIEHDGPLLRVDLDCGFALKALVTPQAAADLKLQPHAAVGVLLKASAIHLVTRS